MLDNTANNLANSNTTAFKRSEVDFHDLLYETRRPAGAEGAQGSEIPTGYQVGSGVRVAGNTKIFTAGATSITNNPLDLAIDGDGFFKVTLPSGDFRYTRDGSFSMNSTGNIVTADGFALTPGITVPQDTVQLSIGTDGTVSALTSSSPGKPTTLGSITLSRFANPAGLEQRGSEPLHRHRRFRHGAGRNHAGRPRHGDTPTKRAGAVQRRRRRGDGQPDYGAAGL